MKSTLIDDYPDNNSFESHESFESENEEDTEKLDMQDQKMAENQR